MQIPKVDTCEQSLKLDLHEYGPAKLIITLMHESSAELHVTGEAIPVHAHHYIYMCMCIHTHDYFKEKCLTLK